MKFQSFVIFSFQLTINEQNYRYSETTSYLHFFIACIRILIQLQLYYGQISNTCNTLRSGAAQREVLIKGFAHFDLSVNGVVLIRGQQLLEALHLLAEQLNFEILYLHNVTL